MATFSEYTKKRKKSFAEYTESVLSKPRDDIAPVKSVTKSNSDSSGLFKKSGLFDDGYQVGDISTGVLATAGDIGFGLVEGVASLGEGLTDLLLYGVSGVSDLVGADDFADDIKELAKRNSVNNFINDFRTDDIKDVSFLGNLGYGVSQGLGQVGAIILTGGAGAAGGLTSAGTTALTTGLMGASSMGSGMSEAYQGGATDEEAVKYGVSKGVIDAGTELIFGGLGKGVKALGLSKGLISIDDMFAKKLSSKISNQFFKNATEWGVKASAEGLEEVLAGIGSAAAKNLTYMSDEELGQLIEDENLLEQFAIGAITSGIAQSGDLVKSTKQGRDFITNRTANEEKVLKAEYESRVAEEEKNGNKLSNKEKNKIYEQVQKDLEKGFISTDTIESVLGGKTYETYKTTSEKEAAQIKDLEKQLKDLANEPNTVGNAKKYDTIQKQLEEIKGNSKTNELKTQLSEEVQKLLTRENGKTIQTDDYLIESYNEKARRGQAYEADLSQYDEKLQTTVQRAIDSGILNNTRRTHEFVDMIAKISADKGVLFDFTNNEKLKESGFAINGKTVNGYVTKDGVTLNIQSAKSLNSVVGHEIAHVLEGTELYTELQSAVMEYAKAKKDYDGRHKALTELYKDVKDADIDAELTADLVGDYLFTDPDFINNLSTNHRNVFQKIYDEVKYLCKIATAGSKEARQLEKVKKAFEEAYRGDVKTDGKAKGETKYSLEQVDGVDYVKAEKNIFVKEDGTLASEREVFNSLVGKTIHTSDGDIKIVKRLPKKDMYNELSRRYPKQFDNVEDIKKLNSDVNYNMEELLNNSEAKQLNMPDENNRHSEQGITGFDTRTVNFYDGGKAYNIEFSIATLQNGEKIAYAKKYFGYDADLTKKIQDAEVRSKQSPLNQHPATYSISQNSEKSIENGKFSLSTDSEGKKLTAEQAEYFKDSKAVDKDGNLLKVYHTTNSDFTVFDKSKQGETTGADNTYLGFFFADDAEYMQNFPEFKNGKTEAYYLNMKNPIDMTNISKEAFIDVVEVFGGDVDEAAEIYDQELSDEKDRAMLRGDNNTSLLLSSLMESVSGEYFSYYDFIDELKPHYDELMSKGYDGVINYLDELFGAKEYIVLDSNQAKLTSNTKPTAHEDIRYSLSDDSETPKSHGKYNVYGKDIAFEAPIREEVAPVNETTSSKMEQVAPIFDIDYSPVVDEMAELEAQIERVGAEKKAIEAEMDKMAVKAAQGLITYDELRAKSTEVSPRYSELTKELDGLIDKVIELEKSEKAENRERLSSLDESDMPPEKETPYYGEAEMPDDPFEDREITAVGNRKVKAYMYENPEVKPFFQEEAQYLFGELQRAEPAETYYNGWIKHDLSFEAAQDIPEVYRKKRTASPDIVYLRDTVGLSYADIEKGLNAIIEDNGAENIAAAKKIEFVLNNRLMYGYTDDTLGFEIPPNQEYINLLNEKQITEYNEEARKKFFEVADDYAPIAEEEIAPTKEYEAIKPKPEKLTGEEAQWAKNKMSRADKVNEEQQTAEILVGEPETAKKKSRGWSMFVRNFVDKQSVFETLALKKKNRKLIAKANQMHNAESSAQWLIGHGTEGVKSLNDIRAEVESTGMTKQFYEYLYHKHNVDRMNLEGRYKDIKNKPVFGYDITAEKSQDIVNQYEFAEPKFKEYAQDVYDYMNHLRGKLVENGVISQETADLWAEMYPHYVPIRREGDSGLNINVPLDTGRTGVNAPIKGATGGSRNIMDLFDTMAMRTEQTYKAIAKNNFGVELKNTLGSGFVANKANFEEVIDSIEKHEELLKKGENGANPTFTVFENGERVTFEITEDMYDALKPTSEGMAYTNKVLNTVGNIRKGLITEYNPVFLATNAIKDAQDVLVNSQHAAQTYKNLPKAFKELKTKGKWYTEYMANGGEQNTYFDGKTNTFTKEDKGIKKVVGIPLRAISAANNFIERAPRLAEYIASREAGATIEEAMLDAARVTTNFAAGGDVTKMLNRNGATFLNASVQGAMQQVRNVREAKANGLKGWLGLAAKFAIAGLPAVLLNALLWEDDEEYEELSDYVKDNYYVVAKYGDGKFVRIPKGRTVAVIQEAFEQVGNSLTGNDEVDFQNFFELAISNLAPNNPIDNNIISPIVQVAQNKTWYGEDLVPSRLQELPKEEQYDESTDSLSRWLGENVSVLSPYQWNYLLDQYSGGVGDVFLPMMTPEAESGDNSLLGNVIAPFKDKFTTDSVMNNQNVSDFYDTVDELATNAKRSNATDEDVLRYKYINSINSLMGKLYAQKREIQNSNLKDDAKYSSVREIQKQIDELAKESLSTYKDVYIENGYATVGNIHYRLNDKGEWTKISEKQLETQDLVTSALGISGSEYWKNKDEYDFAYEYPEKYSVAKAVGGYDTYKSFASDLYDIKADKDANGKTISGSRKEKVIAYINNLDADYGEKIIMFKSVYTADDTYNNAIIEYLNSRDDISYKDMETILKELGFTVHSDGTVTW